MSRWLLGISVGLALGVGAPSPMGPPHRLLDGIGRELAVATRGAVPLEAPKEAPAPVPCKEQSFTLLHFNDLQARYSERLAGRSRYAYLAGYLRSVKANDPATVVLDAGDDYEKGSLVDLRSKGEGTRALLQKLPIDARTIGNHDFAYGTAAVRRDVRESAHPVLSANVRDDLGTFRRSAKLKVGCVRVGVVGLTTMNYGSDDQPMKGPFDGVFLHDPAYAARLRDEVSRLREEVDVVIALTHLGLGEDYALAARVPGVDLIVGGHSEDRLPRPVPVRRADGSVTWIVQAGRFGEFVGNGKVVVESATAKARVRFERYRLVPIAANLPLAEDVDRLVDELEAKYAPDLLEPLGSAKEPYGQYNGMADLVFSAVKSEWHGDALLLGKDLFWKGIPQGPVTLQSLYETVLVQRQPAGTPGFSSLVEVELSGSELSSLANVFRTGTLYSLFLPTKIEPEKTYRFFIEKRAYEHPNFAFARPVKLEGAPRGELIDVLESYVRASWKSEGVAEISAKPATKVVE